MSVITPVYNGARFVAECVASVRAQTFADWRYVIVDNASTDGTAEAARAAAGDDPRITVIEATRHLQIVANWNRALETVHPGAAYVKILHADDLLMPECLARMVALAERHPRVGVVSAYRLAGRHVDLDGLPPTAEVFGGGDIGRWGLTGGPYLFGSPSSLLLRATPVLQRRPFYPEDQFHADTELVYDLLIDWDFGFVHQVLTMTRRHEDSATERYAARLGTWLPGHLQTLARYGPQFLPEDIYRARMRLFLRRYAAYMARQTLRGRPWRDADFRDHHVCAADTFLERLRDEDALPRAVMRAVRDGLVAAGRRPHARRAGR